MAHLPCRFPSRDQMGPARFYVAAPLTTSTGAAHRRIVSYSFPARDKAVHCVSVPSPCLASTLPQPGFCGCSMHCTSSCAALIAAVSGTFGALLRAVQGCSSHLSQRRALQCASQYTCAQACNGQQATQRRALRRGEAHFHGHGEHCKMLTTPHTLRTGSAMSNLAASLSSCNAQRGQTVGKGWQDHCKPGH